MNRDPARGPSLGDRRRLVDHARAIVDTLADARDELSPLQLDELITHVAGVLEELRDGNAAAVEEARRELRTLHGCLDATVGAGDFLAVYQDGGSVPLSRLNPESSVVRAHLRNQQRLA